MVTLTRGLGDGQRYRVTSAALSMACTMVQFRKWPDEFVDTRPVTPFGDALTDVLKEFVGSGYQVTAEVSWTCISMSHRDRMVDFIFRGRLGAGRGHCWEVRLYSNNEAVQLGNFFGIRAFACVVITGVDDVRNITNLWLAGRNVDAILRTVTFWDRVNPEAPLQVPPSSQNATGG